MLRTLSTLFAVSIIGLSSCNKEEDEKICIIPKTVLVDGACVCAEGYHGEDCSQIDACAAQEWHCENGGECLNGECRCEGFWEGEHCELYGPNERLPGLYHVIEHKLLTPKPSSCSYARPYQVSAVSIPELTRMEKGSFGSHGNYAVEGNPGWSLSVWGEDYDDPERLKFRLGGEDYYEKMTFRFDCELSGDTMRCSGQYFIKMRHTRDFCFHDAEFVAVREE